MTDDAPITHQPESQAQSLAILAVRCVCGHSRSVHSFGLQCLAGGCGCRAHAPLGPLQLRS